MSDVIDPVTSPEAAEAAAQESGLERGTYEIIRGRLEGYAKKTFWCDTVYYRNTSYEYLQCRHVTIPSIYLAQ